MSARNGDKSRFGRQRKQKIERRVVLRALRARMPAAETAASPSEAPAGVLEEAIPAEPAAPVAQE